MTRLFKGFVAFFLFLFVGLGLVIILVPPFLDRIYYRGDASGHFDGQRFYNPDGEDTLRPPTGKNRAGFLTRWVLGSGDRPVWPAHVPVTPSKPEARVEGDRMVATWVGHATVLVQTQGLIIMTVQI